MHEMFFFVGTALGGLIFKAVYNNMFVQNNEDEPEHQDLADYFIVVGIVFLVANLGGIFFYGCYLEGGPVPDEEARLISGITARYRSDESIDDVTKKDATSGDAKEVSGDVKRDCDDATSRGSSTHVCNVESRYYPENYGLTLKETLCHPMFHFIAWPCIITQGLYAMTTNNVVVFLESFHLLQYRISLPYTADFSQMVSRPIVGFTSDWLQHRVNRAWYILVGCMIDFVIFCFDIGFLDRIEVLFINVIVLGYACVATFTMTPSLICDEFGVSTFPRNWGMVQGANCVAMFLFCNLISLFYQQYADVESGICMSLLCYSWTYAIASVFALLCVLLISFYVYRKRRGRSR